MLALGVYRWISAKQAALCWGVTATVLIVGACNASKRGVAQRFSATELSHLSGFLQQRSPLKTWQVVQLERHGTDTKFTIEFSDVPDVHLEGRYDQTSRIFTMSPLRKSQDGAPGVTSHWPEWPRVRAELYQKLAIERSSEAYVFQNPSNILGFWRTIRRDKSGSIGGDLMYTFLDDGRVLWVGPWDDLRN